jgi:hypothetical protein
VGRSGDLKNGGRESEVAQLGQKQDLRRYDGKRMSVGVG